MDSTTNLSIISGPTSDFKPQLLHRLFERVIEEKCDDTALIFEDSGKIAKTSYKELNEKSNKIARFIVETVRKQNLQRNSDGDFIIGVSMYPSDNQVVTLLAIWKSGAAYVPIDPAFPGLRIEHICKEVRPVMIIYDQDSDSFMSTTRMSFCDMLDKSVLQSPNNLPESDTLKSLNDDLAIVMYTSGSTGVSKGVRLLHKAILNRLNWQFKTFPYSSTEKVGVFKTALTFVDSVSEIWGPLINGLAILVVKKTTTQDPEKLVTLLEKYENKKPTLNYLRLWVCSGETLVVSLAQEFYKIFPENSHKLLNFYGSTEIMGDVTYHTVEGLDQLKHQENVPIGLPVDNTIIYLLDTNFRPVKVGDVGEICVSGLNLAPGYVNGSDPEKFIDNPLAIDPKFAKLYRTGDYGKIEKGAILYVGRKDSQLKIRGHRVDLSEVEEAVNSLDEVERGIVVCYKPGEIDQALLAFVTTIALVGENKIEDLLRKKLTSYMVPQVILRKTIPLLVSGKVDKQALLMSYKTANNNANTCHQVEINYVGVQKNKMDAANALFETVASVLKRSARSAISLSANFYEIGGNSLNSIFTISNLKEKGYHISIGDFIAAKNFGEVLERMTKGSKSSIATEPPRYTTEMLTDAHKSIVTDMIATSLYYKGDLEQWLKPAISINDYTELIDGLWEPLLQKNLSFVAKNVDGKIEGIAINFDARDIPEVVINTKLTIVIDFFKTLEASFRENDLPTDKGKILYSFKIGTHSSVTPKDNVAVVHFMEGEVLNIASKKKFSGVFATNTSPLTQQLATDVYGYRTLLDYQVNQYVASDNTRPFEMAPNDQRAKVLLHMF